MEASPGTKMSPFSSQGRYENPKVFPTCENNLAPFELPLYRFRLTSLVFAFQNGSLIQDVSFLM